MFSSIRSFVNFLSSFKWTFRLSYDIWRHIWRHNHVSAFNKSKYQNSDTIIAFVGWKYVSIQIFSSIWSFVGILISFEWHFGLFYDTWRHIWRQNIVLPPSTSQNVKILTSQSVFHPKKLTYTHSDQHSHFIEFSGILGDFWTILGRFGGPWRHKRGKDFIILNFWLYHRFFLLKKITHVHF